METVIGYKCPVCGHKVNDKNANFCANCRCDFRRNPFVRENQNYGIRIADVVVLENSTKVNHADDIVTQMYEEEMEEKSARTRMEDEEENLTRMQPEDEEENLTQMQPEDMEEAMTRMQPEDVEEAVTQMQPEINIQPIVRNDVPRIVPVKKQIGKKSLPKETERKKKDSLPVLTFVIALMAIILTGATFFLAKGGKINLTEKKEKEEIQREEQDTDVAKLLLEADALVEKNKTNIFDENLRSDAQKKIIEAIDIYISIGSQEEYREQAREGLQEAAAFYEKGILQQVSMLMEVDTSKAIYEEIVMNLEDALAYEKELQKVGYTVHFSDIKNSRDNIEEKYKALYINEFNKFMDEYNWNVRHNEEFIRGAYEIFQTEDKDDSIRLRYAYAHAWLVHQEIVEGLNDGSMTNLDAVYKIMDAMEETDYCEFLLEEAESYAANSELMNPEYYKNPGRPVILADSSSKKYAAAEIAEMNLSPAELRYARLEIYARHGMESWDAIADAELGSAGQINFYKFMSYNDFGNYSTDTLNGLSKTERHNIRVIAQLQKDAMDAGYFMIR